MTAAVTLPSSITHAHLAATILTELRPRVDGGMQVVRLLDVGCGRGRLIAYLTASLRRHLPGLRIEVYGIDVHDYGAHSHSSRDLTLEQLRGAHPEIDWSDRIASISTQDAWPYPPAHFDVILSNQVLEHVADHVAMFSNIARTLKPGGFSVHLFPLAHCVWEDHIKLPFAHWIANRDLLRAYIRCLSWLGMGRFRAVAAQRGLDLDQYADHYADYLLDSTNYIDQGGLLALGKRARLRTSFRYTPRFYSQKLRSLIRLAQPTHYGGSGGRWADGFSVYFYRYVSSVTLLLEKDHDD